MAAEASLWPRAQTGPQSLEYWKGAFEVGGVVSARGGHLYLCLQYLGGAGNFGRMTIIAPLLQGLGTALLLAIVGLVRDRDEQTEAAASAEVR